MLENPSVTLPFSILNYLCAKVHTVTLCFFSIRVNRAFWLVQLSDSKPHFIVNCAFCSSHSWINLFDCTVYVFHKSTHCSKEQTVKPCIFLVLVALSSNLKSSFLSLLLYLIQPCNHYYKLLKFPLIIRIFQVETCIWIISAC